MEMKIVALGAFVKTHFLSLLRYSLVGVAPTVVLFLLSSKISLVTIAEQVRVNIFFSILFTVFSFRIDIRIKDDENAKINVYLFLVSVLSIIIFLGIESFLPYLLFFFGSYYYHKNSTGTTIFPYRLAQAVIQIILLLMGVFLNISSLVVYSFAISFMSYLFLAKEGFTVPFSINGGGLYFDKYRITSLLIPLYLLLPNIIILVGGANPRQGLMLIEWKVASLVTLAINSYVFDLASGTYKSRNYIRKFYLGTFIVVALSLIPQYLVGYFLAYDLNFQRLCIFSCFSVISIWILFLVRQQVVHRPQKAFSYDNMRVFLAVLGLLAAMIIDDYEILILALVYLIIFIIYAHENINSRVQST